MRNTYDTKSTLNRCWNDEIFISELVHATVDDVEIGCLQEVDLYYLEKTQKTTANSRLTTVWRKTCLIFHSLNEKSYATYRQTHRKFLWFNWW